MRDKMTTNQDFRSVAAGIGISRTRFDNIHCRGLVGVMALLLCIAGNNYAQSNASWPFYRFDASLSGQARVDGPTIPDLFWVKNIGLEKIESPVVNAEGVVIFTGRGDKYVYALNRDGSEKWRFSYQGSNNTNETFSHPPTIGSDGTIYAGTEEGGFFAIDPDGKLKWRVAVGGYVGTAPNIDREGRIYLACDDAQLYVFNPAGDLLCVGSLDGLKPGSTPAIVSNQQIYVPAGNSIFVFNSFCERLARWNFPVLEEVAWVVGNSNGSTLYVGSRSKPIVLAIDAQTGKQVWSYSYDARFGRPSQPALGPDGSIYFAGFDAGLLVALNPNGKEKWTHDQGSARYKTMPVVDASGDIYIVNESLGLAAFASDKTLLWNLPNVQCKYSPAFGPDGTIYVPSLKKLYAVRPQPPFASSLELVDGNGQTGCADSLLGNIIQARVRDQYGNLFEGQPVRFRAIMGGGQPIDTTVNTLAGGIASIEWRLGAKLGEQQLAVSSSHNGQHLSGSPDTVFAQAVGPQIDGKSLVVFNTTAVKDSSDTTYTIFNRSGCILTIERLEILGSTAFSEIPPFVKNIPIPPQDSLVVRLRFAPRDSGTNEATLKIYSNDNTKNPFFVALRGEAFTRPLIDINPLNLNFGAVKVGDDSMQTIKISNLGTAALIVSALTFSDAAYATPTPTPFEIPPDGSKLVPIFFEPTVAQQYLATLKVESNDSIKNPVIVKLDGRGTIAPDIHASPNPLILVACNDSTVTETVTISNRGNATLEITSLVSNNPAFSFDGSGFSLLPNESKSIPVTFSPKAVKADSAVMIIACNDPDEPTFQVKLRGEVNGPKILLTAKHSLLELCRGQSAMVEVCIKNPSNCVLRVDSLEYIFIFASELEKQAGLPQKENAIFDFPRFINPGDSLCFPPHKFVGTAVSFDILVRARSNGTPDPDTLKIPVKIKPPMIASSNQVDFGSVVVGESKLDSANIWSAQCQVSIPSEPKITGLDAFAFTLSRKLSYPIVLDEGKNVSIPVIFNPKDSGVHIAFLEVISNDPSTERDTIRIKLVGNGAPLPEPEPIITVSPDTTFGVVCVDTAFQDVVVSNIGTAPLEVLDLVIDNPSFFTTHAKQFSLIPKGSETVRVGYVRVAGQPALGQLLVRSNATTQDSIVILKGEGGVPKIAGRPSPLPFATVNIRDCATGLQDSTSAIYEISNPGMCDLVITSFKVDGNFAIAPITLPFIIPKNESAKVTLYFKPQEKGSFTGALHIFSNALNEKEHIVALQGTATATPRIAAKPDTLKFVDVQINISADLPVTVMNDGSDTLQVTKIEVTGTAFKPDMALFSLTCKDTRQVNVTFTPNALGAFVDTLTFTSNGGTKKIVLMGNSIPGPEPCISVAPQTIEFGAVCASTLDYAVISNSCPGTLVVSSIKFSNPNFTTTHTLPFNVKPNATDTLWVQYTPISGEESNGTMEIASNDPAHPIVTVSLHGTGGAADISAPAELAFPDTKVDSTKARTLSIANLGECAMHAKMTIIGTHASDFKLTSSDTIDIANGTAAQVSIGFTPHAPGLREATLVIKSNDPDTSLWNVRLFGNGIGEALLDVVPDTLDFGEVTVNEKKSLKLYLKSIGRAALDITGCVTEPPVIFESEYCKRSDDDATPILPGGMDSTTVVFAPAAEQYYTGTLTFFSNDASGKPIRVYLRGRGVTGNLVVDPNPLPLHEICVGRDTVINGRIINNGPGNMYIYGPLRLASERDTSPFRIVAPIFSEKDTTLIQPTESLSFKVKFKASEFGTYNESLLVVTNLHPASQPFSIPLRGAVAESLKFEITPILSFVGKVDQETAMQQVLITNLGCTPLELGQLQLLKGKHFFIKRSFQPTRLLKGESVIAMISFKGDNFKTFEDELSVPTNDPQYPKATATLNGKVLDGSICFRAEPERVDFGKIKVRQSSDQQEVKLVNCSKETRLEATILRPDKNEAFKLNRAESEPFRILPDPNSGYNFVGLGVKFIPTVSGVQEETLELSIRIPDSAHSVISYVTLRGEGVVDAEKVEVVSNVVTPNGDEFNPEAIIEFSETKHPAAVLRLFDLRGLQVRVFHRPTGPNRFAWDGRDENRGLVLPGVYLWILEEKGKRIDSGRISVIR